MMNEKIHKAIDDCALEVARWLEELHNSKSFYDHMKSLGELSISIRGSLQQLQIKVSQISIANLKAKADGEPEVK